jgi:hypothetical protein
LLAHCKTFAVIKSLFRIIPQPNMDVAGCLFEFAAMSNPVEKKGSRLTTLGQDRISNVRAKYTIDMILMSREKCSMS